PYWLTSDSQRIRTIAIPLPDGETRRRLAVQLYPEIPESDRDTPENIFANTLANLTHNMSLNAMTDIFDLALANHKPASDIDEAVQSYRVGDINLESPWRSDLLRQNILDAEDPESDGYIGKRVKGQRKAISKVFDILKRISVGLTGAQSNAIGGRPRGVLFFAGPTGVGKTELAKSIAQIVFGDQNAYKRFDMSEFSEEHSGDRLIGAPPGYVGYNEGGELTNAIREQPFRVLLFDEIEKAHNKILDKFLQILEDGRLTDGRGDTVYFSESLIIFTSNAGISRERRDGSVEYLVSPEDSLPPDEFERIIMGGIKDYFRKDLRRPELLNRFGENIVIFNFISPEVAREILTMMIDNVRRRVEDEHDLRLDISEPVTRKLNNLCVADNLVNGGRGIGSRLEEVFINPLARLIFDQSPKPGDTLRLTQLDEKDGIHELHGE
ncbi:MAG TPA: ATP-dependent Clp protease ATP-binding subunit, partial [Gammaproteobacteria bacterium]|nr:ATP-dependent Clp protease ATP-binding subunit [Gammaproteobacteria bacterium]